MNYYKEKAEDLKLQCAKLQIDLPLSENTNVLGQDLIIHGRKFANRLAIQPMEGCDGDQDGGISELVHRRYMRFASGAAGLIWFEATAVVPEGKANPLQLQLNKTDADGYKRLIFDMKETAVRETGVEPIIICQLTHSGRQSKPNGKPKPLTAYRNPIFEKSSGNYAPPIIDDSYLDELPEHFASAALLAQDCGFDGVDIKSCHGYLLCEMLSAYNRENSKYGGSFENRTRLLCNCIEAVKEKLDSSMIVTSRLGIYDGFPYPYGFGVKDGADVTPWLDEAKALVKILIEKYQYEMLDITIGNPYVNPHVNRPFQSGPYPSPENPLCGVARMMDCTKEIKTAFPNLKIVGSGFSFLKELSPNLAAGSIEHNYCDIAGFGRMSLAYPDFAKDILSSGFNKNKSCIACSKCSALMRAGSVAGCVIRDSETYLPYYREKVQK